MPTVLSWKAFIPHWDQGLCDCRSAPSQRTQLGQRKESWTEHHWQDVTIATFPCTAPQGTRLTHAPFSLAVICCDPSWKEGPLWKVWDQQSQSGRPAGQGDKNTCAPPFAGYVQEKENPGGKSGLGSLKASARVEMINVSHQVMY